MGSAVQAVTGAAGSVGRALQNPAVAAINPFAAAQGLALDKGPGLAKQAGQVLQSPAATVLNPTNFLTGAALETVFGGEDKKEPDAPGMDPRLTDIQREQLKQAEDFKKNLPGMKDQAFGNIAQGERRRLAQELAGIDQNANSRGLLYSGLRAGRRAQAEGASAGNLAQARTEVNRNYDQQADMMRQQALNTSMGIQQTQQQVQDQIFQTAMANAAARRTGMMGLFQGAGAVGGAALGRRA